MKEIISLGVKGGIWDLDLLFSSGWPWASYFSSVTSVNRGHWSKCFQKSLYYDLHWRHIKISHHSPGQELTMSVHRQLHQIENSTTPAPHTLSSPWPTVQDTLNVLRLPQAPGRPHSPVRSHSLAHVTFSPRQNSSFPGPLPIIPQPSALLRPPPWDLRPPQPIFTFQDSKQWPSFISSFTLVSVNWWQILWGKRTMFQPSTGFSTSSTIQN